MEDLVEMQWTTNKGWVEYSWDMFLFCPMGISWDIFGYESLGNPTILTGMMLVNGMVSYWVYKLSVYPPVI
jgi:hypothetical protein